MVAGNPQRGYLRRVLVEALRRHLELARQGLLSTRRFPTWLDDARREAKFLEIFEAEEARLGKAERRRLLRQIERWDGEFTWILVERLIAGFAGASLLTQDPARDEATLDAAVRGVLARNQLIDAMEPASSGVREQRFTRCIREADDGARAERSDLEGFSVRRYADELQLVRATPDGIILRPAGEVCLGLRGRDAARWLLALEVSSALGDEDRWRLSVGRAKAFAEARPTTIVEDGDPPSWPWDYPTRRFELEGLVEVSEEQDEHGRHYWTCRVTPLGAELFGELEQLAGEALRSLARAILVDEAHEVLHGRPPAVSEAAELGRHTRMVAHELRNILVPVQLTLKQLRRQARGASVEAENTAALDNIASALERALRFATETARVTSQGVSRAELFAAEAAVRDAIAAVQPDLRHPVDFTSSAGVERVYLRGRRERFVLAVLNLLRNASQAGGAEVRITVRADTTSGEAARLVVVVEDDGPGVPVGQQDAIFADGVSFRAGGSGHGLALVREVIEDELRGAIHYEAGARGGARFVLKLPIPLEGAP